MSIFNRGISTEQEDTEQQSKEEVWVLTESGELVELKEVVSNEDD